MIYMYMYEIVYYQLWYTEYCIYILWILFPNVRSIILYYIHINVRSIFQLTRYIYRLVSYQHNLNTN